jgi:hypothetical protein
VRGRDEIAGRIGDVITKRLVGRRFIDAKDETRVRRAIQRVIVETGRRGAARRRGAPDPGDTRG